MKIAVVGTGYVGLVTGACFAETGLTVTCVDIDHVKINNLKKGVIPIYEPGLERIIDKNVKKGRLFFSTEIKEGLKESDAVFISVGTPPDEDGSADLQHVLSVASEIGKNIDHYMVVVTKSTVPIGTAEKVRAKVNEELSKRGVDIEFDMASNPEFLKEGSAVDDFLKPDRIVIGVDSERAENILSKLYKPFVLNNHPVIMMDIKSSELTKYAANAMLATKISFMNEVANLCEMLGADVNLVRKGIGSDPRIGPKFIYAGAGYGGSCFPKDVKALIRTANEKEYRMRILQAVEDVNEDQKSILFHKIYKHFEGDLKNKKFALWGLSFKPNTDDMREAPSLVMIERLIREGATVEAYDPIAMKEAKRILGDKATMAEEQYKALENADALILITEWSEFRLPDFDKIGSLLNNKLIFDGRNIYDPVELRNIGFTYYGIGRK